MPLVRDEEIVGAIGISGGSVDQDQGIADAGDGRGLSIPGTG